MQNQDDCAINTNSVDSTSPNLTVSRVEKVETPKKPEKKDDVEDPKPRIVLTFRSEKSGAKSSNMKIVTPEEKQEEVSPRRSSRTRHTKPDNFEERENESTSRRDKSQSSQPVSENDDTSDSSNATRRSAPRRNKEVSDMLSTAIARKEKSFTETAPTPTQRLSRRIKPTAKILANEELRIGLESQNNARLGIQSDKPEEGVSTRRAGQAKGADAAVPERRSTKRKAQGNKELEGPKELVMKLKHLCELGLKATSKSTDDDSSDDNDNSEFNPDEADCEDEEIDDDTEIINKLLEADEEEWDGESSDDEYLLSGDNSQSDRPRRSRRLCSSYANDSDNSLPTAVEEKPKSRPRRSSRRTTTRVSYEYGSLEHSERQFENESNGEFSPKRKKTRSYDPDEAKTEAEENSNPALGEDGEEAACPTDGDSSAVVATCYCEEPSNVYADPSELTDPVFCQALEMVDGVRCGCSHGARRGSDRTLAPLLRAGPRAPFFLACRLHAAQLARHMCCPTCGIFCTQGVFYQCSLGHLFHLECGVGVDARLTPGCPHCGVTAHRWQPASRDCVKVRIEMHCSNERIYLPDQRVQCTPAYLSFSTTEKPQLDSGPVIPEDLLPSLPIDLKKMCEESAAADYEELLAEDPAERLYDAVVNGESVEQLIPKIVRARGSGLCRPLAARGGDTCAHAAAARGRLGALYALQYAQAALDAPDAAGRTPLMRALLALLDKNIPEEMEVEHNEDPSDATEDNIDLKEEAQEEVPMDLKEEAGEDPMELKEESKDKGEVEQKKETDQPEVQAETKQEVEGREADEINSNAKVEEPKDDDDKDADDRPSDEDLMKVIRYLVAAGCDLNLPGPEGMTALHLAAQYGSASTLAVLLAGGARVDPRDTGGWTPLVRAAEHDHEHVVRMLLDAGAEACAADTEGNGAAHWCALAGAARALRPLLAAAPHAAHLPNHHGDTPLHIAAREGHYSCVVILLARGARTDVENTAGELPVEVCAGRCQAAVSLNMQLALAVRDKGARRRVLDSDIARGREPFPVECVNDVDDEPAPSFTYVSRHVLPEPLAIDTSLVTMQGCTCADGCCAGETCSCGALGVRRWYRAGRLPSAFPYHDPPMLFECNQTCSCNLKRCTNHVVSSIEATGSLGVRVRVFRTVRRGWGLAVCERVPRGAAVALYCGELLPHAVADARDQDQYMFALDVKPDLLEQCVEKTQLCVDAARFGSCARFVNHSCRPNLAPVRVFTNTRDLRLPAVALFALKDIAVGEELTYEKSANPPWVSVVNFGLNSSLLRGDPSPEVGHSWVMTRLFDYGDKFWAVKSKWMKCECESPDCRYPTKTTDENSS